MVWRSNLPPPTTNVSVIRSWIFMGVTFFKDIFAKEALTPPYINWSFWENKDINIRVNSCCPKIISRLFSLGANITRSLKYLSALTGVVGFSVTFFLSAANDFTFNCLPNVDVGMLPSSCTYSFLREPFQYWYHRCLYCESRWKRYEDILCINLVKRFHLFQLTVNKSYCLLIRQPLS